MVRFFEEGIPINDIDENTPLIDDGLVPGEHVEDTSFTNPTFVDDDESQQINGYETPIGSRGIVDQRREITRYEVKKLYDHMGFDVGNVDFNLDKFRTRSVDGFILLEYEKNGRWYSLTRKTDGEFKTPDQINKIITKTVQKQLGFSIKRLDDLIPTE